MFVLHESYEYRTMNGPRLLLLGLGGLALAFWFLLNAPPEPRQGSAHEELQAIASLRHRAGTTITARERDVVTRFQGPGIAIQVVDAAGTPRAGVPVAIKTTHVFDALRRRKAMEAAGHTSLLATEIFPETPWWHVHETRSGIQIDPPYALREKRKRDEEEPEKEEKNRKHPVPVLIHGPGQAIPALQPQKASRSQYLPPELEEARDRGAVLFQGVTDEHGMCAVRGIQQDNHGPLIAGFDFPTLKDSFLPLADPDATGLRTVSLVLPTCHVFEIDLVDDLPRRQRTGWLYRVSQVLEQGTELDLLCLTDWQETKTSARVFVERGAAAELHVCLQQAFAGIHRVRLTAREGAPATRVIVRSNEIYACAHGRAVDREGLPLADEKLDFFLDTGFKVTRPGEEPFRVAKSASRIRTTEEGVFELILGPDQEPLNHRHLSVVAKHQPSKDAFGGAVKRKASVDLSASHPAGRIRDLGDVMFDGGLILVAGIVTDERGTPIPSAHLRCVEQAASRQRTKPRTFQSNPDGTFEIRGLSAWPTLQLSARAAGYLPVKLDVPRGSATVRLVLHRAASLHLAFDASVSRELCKRGDLEVNLTRIGAESITKGPIAVRKRHSTIEGIPAGSWMVSISLLGEELLRIDRVDLEPTGEGGPSAARRVSLAEKILTLRYALRDSYGNAHQGLPVEILGTTRAGLQRRTSAYVTDRNGRGVHHVPRSWVRLQLQGEAHVPMAIAIREGLQSLVL